MSSRFVAVLTLSSRASIEGRTSNDALSGTFSHELVHAFLNARLDPVGSPEGFPRWFHEGMAIHYSDGGRAHISVDPLSGGLLRIEPTAEYEQYARVFRYLESELGTDRFNREVRRSVEDVDPAALYRAPGFHSYDNLRLTAELWWRWWPVPLTFVRGGNLWWWGGGLMAALSACGFAAWRRWQPAVPGSALEVGVNRDLIEAVKTADTVNIGYLLRSGANPSTRDNSGWSALAWAVWVNDPRIVDMLLERGAEVDPQIRTLAQSPNCSPRIVHSLADAVTRFDDDSIEIVRT